MFWSLQTLAATASSPLGTFMVSQDSSELLQGPMLGASGRHCQPSLITTMLQVFIFDDDDALPNLVLQDPLLHVLQQLVGGVNVGMD